MTDVSLLKCVRTRCGHIDFDNQNMISFQPRTLVARTPWCKVRYACICVHSTRDRFVISGASKYRIRAQNQPGTVWAGQIQRKGGKPTLLLFPVRVTFVADLDWRSYTIRWHQAVRTVLDEASHYQPECMFVQAFHFVHKQRQWKVVRRQVDQVQAECRNAVGEIYECKCTLRSKFKFRFLVCAHLGLGDLHRRFTFSQPIEAFRVGSLWC